MLKWNHSESPYFLYGQHHFERVRELFRAMGVPSNEDMPGETEVRLAMMEKAMSRLDAEGLFGSGTKRLGIVVNVEVMPPDHTNVERALRLNPREALKEWMEEAAEDP